MALTARRWFAVLFVALLAVFAAALFLQPSIGRGGR